MNVLSSQIGLNAMRKHQLQMVPRRDIKITNNLDGLICYK